MIPHGTRGRRSGQAGYRYTERAGENMKTFHIARQLLGRETHTIKPARAKRCWNVLSKPAELLHNWKTRTSATCARELLLKMSVSLMKKEEIERSTFYPSAWRDERTDGRHFGFSFNTKMHKERQRKRAFQGRELDLATPESSALFFDQLDPVPVYFFNSWWVNVTL